MKMEALKSYLVLGATGAVLVVTDDNLEKHPERLKHFAAGSLKKFIAYEVPLDSVKSKYAAHFEHTLSDPKQRNEFIVLDDDGLQIFENIKLKELGRAIFYEEGSAFVRRAAL